MRTINKTLINISLLSLTLCFTSSAIAKIYKWTDASGKTHYTATPPPAKTKAKTEEFKVQKIKKSSLSNHSYAESSSNKSNSSNKTRSANASGNAQSQCSKAVRKYPAVLSKLKRKLTKAKAAGKMTEAQYSQALDQVKQERQKVQSISECVKDYKRGGKDANAVNLIANNSAADALTYLMLGAAFDQAERSMKKK